MYFRHQDLVEVMFTSVTLHKRFPPFTYMYIVIYIVCAVYNFLLKNLLISKLQCRKLSLHLYLNHFKATNLEEKKKCPENKYWLEANLLWQRKTTPIYQISCTVTYHLTLYITLLSDDLENYKLIYLY